MFADEEKDVSEEPVEKEEENPLETMIMATASEDDPAEDGPVEEPTMVLGKVEQEPKPKASDDDGWVTPKTPKKPAKKEAPAPPSQDFQATLVEQPAASRRKGSVTKPSEATESLKEPKVVEAAKPAGAGIPDGITSTLTGIGIEDKNSQKWVLIGGGVFLFLCCSCSCVAAIASIILANQ